MKKMVSLACVLGFILMLASNVMSDEPKIPKRIPQKVPLDKSKLVSPKLDQAAIKFLKDCISKTCNNDYYTFKEGCSIPEDMMPQNLTCYTCSPVSDQLAIAKCAEGFKVNSKYLSLNAGKYGYFCSCNDSCPDVEGLLDPCPNGTSFSAGYNNPSTGDASYRCDVLDKYEVCPKCGYQVAGGNDNNGDVFCMGP